MLENINVLCHSAIRLEIDNKIIYIDREGIVLLYTHWDINIVLSLRGYGPRLFLIYELIKYRFFCFLFLVFVCFWFLFLLIRLND